MNRYAVHGMMNSDNDFTTGKIAPTHPRLAMAESSGLRQGSPGDDARGGPPALSVAGLAHGSTTAIGGGCGGGISTFEDADAPPKKKRKSPAVPWKKPVGMPKRPLSSYNLFFASEREKLIARLSAGPEGEEGKAESSIGAGEEDTTEELYDEGDAGGAVDDSPVAESPKSSPTGTRGKKKGRKLGVGFANLAKTIAAKWKTLDPEERAPFEERASVDKKRYDAEVSEWRVKQKAEKAEKKAKGGASPKREPLSQPPGAEHSPSLLHGGFPEFAAVSDPYPADWFDVQMAPSTSRDSATRNLEESGTFESTQASAYPAAATATHQHSPLRLGELQFNTGPLRMGRGSGLAATIPFLQQDRSGTGIHQPSLLDWGTSQTASGALASRDMPFAINLEPRYTSQSQSHDAIGVHEFAQALPSQATSRPPSPPSFRFATSDDSRATADLQSWVRSGGWAHQQGSQGYAAVPVNPSSPRNQYEPLPFENPMSFPPYVPYPRAASMRMPQSSDLMQQQFTGPRRHSEGADSRTRQTFGTSLEPMPPLYHPSLSQSSSLSYQQLQQPQFPFSVEPRMLSMIHNTHQQQEYLQQQQFLQQQLVASQQAIVGSEQHSSAGHPPTAVLAGESASTGQDHAADPPGDPQDQPSEAQQQEPSSTETESSAFQGISQRLDDDTIDFITRLPFP